MRFGLIFVLIFSFSFSFVVEIEGEKYDKQDFYSKYSKLEWDNSSDEQKNKLLLDYIKRESCVKEALSLGFLFDPVVEKRIGGVKDQLLINSSYNFLVAMPVVGDSLLSVSKNNLKTDVLIKHLLIGHQGSSLRSPPNRTKEEALSLILSLKDSLSGDVNPFVFENIARAHSDDPAGRASGGEVGWLSWGRTPMSFQGFVWDVPVGFLSGVLETQHGYHLVLVVDKRESEYALYDDSSYNNAALQNILPLFKDSLVVASKSFDDSLFGEGGVVFFKNQIDLLYLLIEEEKKTIESQGGRFNFLDFCSTLDDRFVLCLFNNKYYGVKWFVGDVSSRGRPPNIYSQEALYLFFKNTILREHAKTVALSEKIDSEVFFKKRLRVETGKILYEQYLKFLVNSVSPPDSLGVVAYYNEHKEEKYLEPEKVLVRQIKVSSKTLADSLFSELEKKPDQFESFVQTFSLNPGEKGGLMTPFKKGKYNTLGDKAFLLSVGEMSGVIENLDKSFSIIRLEEVFSPKKIPLKTVYKRIESLLIKKYQEDIKTKTFDRYINNPNLLWSDEYKKYIN